MAVKRSKDFIPELCLLVIFNIVFGALYWGLDKKGCFKLMGRFYVFTGIIYTFWLCILSVTQEGCEKFKITCNFFIEVANFLMTAIFFIEMIYSAKRNNFCGELSTKILSYVFLAIAGSIFLILLIFFIKKVLASRKRNYRPVSQEI